MLRHLAAVVAVLAFSVWVVLCWRAMVAHESHTAAGERMWAFIVMMGAAFTAWPYRRHKDGDEEEF